MAFLSIPNIQVKGISACVPSAIEENMDYPLKEEEKQKLIASIGVERKRIADKDVCTSDLCLKAAEVLIRDLGWQKEDIDCLIFVTHSPDYIQPATACILQDRLGLSEECYAMEISSGCSGYVYGMSTAAALLSNGVMKKALVLAGETPSKISSREDKSAWPLFGDAGTATAIEFADDSDGIQFHMATDGSGKNAIHIEDGGYRNWFTPDSLKKRTYEEGITRTKLDLSLDGMNVFSFALSKVPQSINKLIERFNIDQDEVDYYIFHQANLFLNERVRKKLKLDAGKVPYSLKNYGNTSSASIPLTMVTEIGEELKSKALHHVACGFGVGLSWGSMYFSTDNIVCPELIIY